MFSVTPIVEFCNFSMFCIMSILVLHSSWWGREKAGCFTCTVFVFLVSCDCCVALPHDDTGLSAVCDCGIS